MKMPFGIDMGQINKIKEQAEEMKKEVAAVKATGTAGGDMVTVTVTGDDKVESVSISEEAYSVGGREGLEVLVKAAFGDALSKLGQAKEAKQRELAQKAMSGMGLF